MTTKARLILVLIVASFFFGLAWVIQSNRYEVKLLRQEKSYVDAQRIIQEKHRDALKEQQAISDKAQGEYRNEVLKLQDQIKQAELANISFNDVIDGLRKQQDYLRTRIRTVSDEAIREYAAGASTALTEISEALRAEQLAHQETSRKADEYYSAWKALDDSWPK